MVDKQRKRIREAVAAKRMRNRSRMRKTEDNIENFQRRKVDTVRKMRKRANEDERKQLKEEKRMLLE